MTNDDPPAGRIEGDGLFRRVCRLADECRRTSANTTKFWNQAWSFIGEPSRCTPGTPSHVELIINVEKRRMVNMRVGFVRYGIALLFSATLFAASPPSVISSRYGAHHPIFISASAMVSADGTTAAVVPEDWRPGLQQLAEIFSGHRRQVSAFSLPSSAPCHGRMLTDEPLEQFVDISTPHNRVVNAYAIVAGTIRSVTPGFFYDGLPGSLIELDNLDKIKLDAWYKDLGESLYLRLPYPQFVVNGIEYCRESSPGAYIPTVGDRLLVFAYRAPSDAAGTFLYAGSREVIAQPSGGTILIPKVFSFLDDKAATIATVTTVIRSELSHRERPVVGHDGRAQ
jgi:hypothetical protein